MFENSNNYYALDRVQVGANELLMPLLILLVIYIFSKIKRGKIALTDEKQRYYFTGLYLKLLAGTIFAIIYVFVYHEGDTVTYFKSAVFMDNLAEKNFSLYWDLLINGADINKYSYFDGVTGSPAWYMFRDPNTFFVVRFISPIVYITGKSYFAATLFLSWLSYSGLWELYKLVIKYYPSSYKELAFAILFFPSVIFWGSGIMKDTITLSSVAWYTYAFHGLVIKRRFSPKNVFIILISASLILAIKPYIFIALMPGSLIWGTFDTVKNVKNKIVRLLIAPVIILITFAVGSSVMSKLSGKMGDYGSIDKALNKALATQQDLKRSEYGGNSFDIGDFDPSLGGVLSKAPIAIVSGLFRPFIWEVRNFFMLLAASENLLLIYLLVTSIYKVGLFKYIKIVREDPFLIFMVIFSIFFAFSIGLTTANFGALVRYKIPLLPFLVSAVFIINRKVKDGVVITNKD